MQKKGQLVETDYEKLLGTIDGIVKKVSVGVGIDRYLRIEIENIMPSSPVRVVKYYHDNTVPVLYGDRIQAYYIAAKEVITKTGFMGAPLERYFIPRNPRTEETATLINVLNDRAVVAAYGFLPKGKVMVQKKS